MEFTFSEILPNIYLFLFEQQYDLCMAFVRLAELDESTNDKFNNKYFSLEEYMEWYAQAHGDGAFTYPKDWRGFNIPGKTFKKWYYMFKDKLRPCEKEIVKKIMKLYKKIGDDEFDKIYFIATFNGYGMNATIKHEIAHAIYDQNVDYKKAVHRLLLDMPKDEKARMKKRLLDIGYSKQNIIDEMNAYLSTGGSRRIPIKDITFKKEFRKLLREYT